MNRSLDSVKQIDLSKANPSSYRKHLADCVILTHDNKLLLQERPITWEKFAGSLTLFGGHVEAGESIEQALIRELKEELGAEVLANEVTTIGAITESWTHHQELVHVHFWHDKEGTITGCYEGEARYYPSVEDALSHPKILDYACWALNRCQAKNLLK